MVFVDEEMRCGGLSTWNSSSEKKAARWSFVPVKGGSGHWKKWVYGWPEELVAEGIGGWLTVGREFLEEALVGNNGIYGLRWLASCSNGMKRG